MESCKLVVTFQHVEVELWVLGEWRERVVSLEYFVTVVKSVFSEVVK